jgi:hypothetical protein
MKPILNSRGFWPILLPLGLALFTVSTFAQPHLQPLLQGQWPEFARGYAYDVKVVGNDAYLALRGLQVLDVSDPTRPVWVAGCDTGGAAMGVAVAGNYAYVADGDWGLTILRLPAAPGPELRIRRAANAVILAWSSGESDFILESAWAVQPPLQWEPVSEPVVPVGEEQTVTLSPTNQARYFRLRQ